MKRFITILILAMSFGIFCCNNKTEKDFVFDEFKSQIEKKGMKIDSVDKTGLIYISQGELTLKISLDNVRRNYQRDKDETHISDFVSTLFSNLIDLPSTWAEVKDSIYISLFPNDYEFKDLIHSRITDEFGKVYVHSGANKLSWLTKDDIKKWNINVEEIDKQANLNADILLGKTNISIEMIENHKLGLIEIDHASLKGALLFAPTMKDKIKVDFGFPFYAVIPVRDFCYIFSEKDFDFFSGRIGSIVVEEYKKSGYPITTEILKFSSNGVEPVGKYPIK